MKIAALIWFACFAIYLELLVRARPRPQVTPPLPWPIVLLGAGVVASLLWAAWIGRIATTTIQAVVAQIW
jgi:hypothetical protein